MPPSTTDNVPAPLVTSGGTSTFDYSAIPEGYYHDVMTSGSPIRRAWHLQKFERVLDCLPTGTDLGLIDIGCFAGSFLSLVKPERFSRQVGVDILDRQILYARKHFGTAFRRFAAIRRFRDILSIDGEFDCVTSIEVIEHLMPAEIAELFDTVREKLKPGGLFVLSTPNYTSFWPVLELGLNYLSDVTYEEQHVTKFTYFNVEKKLARIYPGLKDHFTFEMKTTTHFASPFLAPLSLEGSRKLSRLFPHQSWPIPFGSLLLMGLRRN